MAYNNGGNRFNNYGSNNNNKVYDSNYYSRLNIKNPDTGDSLSIKYSAGLMTITMEHRNAMNQIEPVVAISLSAFKSMLLKQAMEAFFEYKKESKIDESKAFGVNTGMGDRLSFIGFSTNKDKDNIITIGKMNGQGNVTDSFKYTFVKNYHYNIEWTNIDKMEFDKNFANDLEVTALYKAIADFADNISGAAGYAALDLGRYEYNRLIKKIDPIYDKLGIERNINYSNGGGYNNNGGTISDKLGSRASKTIYGEDERSGGSINLDSTEDLLGEDE